MRRLILIVLFFSFFTTKAQKPIDEVEKEILTIGVGPQVNSFFGDIGSNSLNKIFTSARPCISIDSEKRFGKVFGLQLMFVKGKLSENTRSAFPNENLNFESNFTKVNLNLIINTDNYLKIKSNISPYFTLGAGWLQFNSYGDLLDENNVPYNYWSDGTIRNIAESDTNAGNASFLYRDYNYETGLYNDSINYKNYSFLAPITIGLKWKINPYLQGRVFTTYNYLFTDWVDNISAGNNDYYISLGFTMNYAIHKLHFEKKEKINIDIEAFNNSDEDKDGVIDILDDCPHTDKKIKVDLNGCPIDTDKDGVPDHLDKEPNSKNFKYVDEFGRGITDSILYNRFNKEVEIEIQRNQTFSDSSENELNFNNTPLYNSFNWLHHNNINLNTEKYSNLLAIKED